jgi:hypothetical protein
MKFPVRLLLGLFFLLLSFFVLKSVSFAQTKEVISPQQNSSNLITNTNPDVPNNLHNWTQTVLIEVLSATSCLVAGVDPSNPNQQCLGVDQKTGKIGYVKNGGGAIGILASNLSAIYTPPVHTGDYLSYLSNSFGVTKHSYAAGPSNGIGFDQLSPLTNIWVAFRNITYLFFVIIFLVIGVAVMLRVRIDPRTVMTIQNQIPKIIIGIVMVTFSFAIAGFLIDMMWTSTYVVYGVLNAVPKSTDPKAGIQNLSPEAMRVNTPLGIVNEGDGGSDGQSYLGFFTGGVYHTSDTIASHFRDILINALGAGVHTSLTINPLDMAGNVTSDLQQGNVVNVVIDIASLYAGGKAAAGLMNLIINSIGAPTAEFLGVGGSAGNLVAAGIATGPSILLGTAVYGVTQVILREVLPWFIIFMVIYFTIFITLIRLWFELIKAYIFILFDIIFAPFWIIAGLIPGNTGVNFSSWIRDLGGNIAIFPATAAMFWIGKILMDAWGNPANAGTGFVPPLVGNAMDTHFISALIGLGVLLSTPQIGVMIKKFIKAPGVGLGGAAQALSAGGSVVTGGVKSAARTYMKTPKMGDRGGVGALVRGLTGM